MYMLFTGNHLYFTVYVIEFSDYFWTSRVIWLWSILESKIEQTLDLESLFEFPSKNLTEVVDANKLFFVDIRNKYCSLFPEVLINIPHPNLFIA